jgi:hypothetical protein
VLIRIHVASLILSRRITAFSVYENDTTNTYAFDNIPIAKEWGVNWLFDDKSAVMCKPGTNKPIMIWILGLVTHTWFFDKESNPAAQVSINVVPINDPTSNTARHLISLLSKPSIGMLYLINLYRATFPEIVISYREHCRWLG